MDLIDVSRKSFKAIAVRVTEENMFEVAVWCGGTLESSRIVPEASPVQRIILQKQVGARVIRRQFIFVGHWVVKNGEQFTAYKDSSFRGSFDQTPRQDLAMAYKSGQILGAVVKALDKRQGGLGPIGEDARLLTDEIMKIFGGNV